MADCPVEYFGSYNRLNVWGSQTFFVIIEQILCLFHLYGFGTVPQPVEIRENSFYQNVVSQKGH